jgi:thymidylate synthase
MTKRIWPENKSGTPSNEAEAQLLLHAEKHFAMRKVSLENQYASSLVNLLNHGIVSGDRTGTGTLRQQNQYFFLDVSNDILPSIRGKQIYNKKIMYEALWMFQGLTNTKYLRDNGVRYWDKWADENGELGPIYGKQMRDFNGIDQLSEMVGMIRKNPEGRRIMMTLWNPSDLKSQRLPPCHLLYQICVNQDENGIPYMDMHVTQRSGDSFLGIPFDFVLFTAFFRIISEVVGLACNHIHYTIADYHMYLNHEIAVRKYIDNVAADPLGILQITALPKLIIPQPLENIGNNIDDRIAWLVQNPAERLKITDYVSYPHIPAEIAV